MQLSSRCAEADSGTIQLTRLVQTYWLSAIDFDCSFAIPWLLFYCPKHSWVSHACYILQPLCQMLLKRSALISLLLRMSHLYKFAHDQAFVMARSEPLPRRAGLF